MDPDWIIIWLKAVDDSRWPPSNNLTALLPSHKMESSHTLQNDANSCVLSSRVRREHSNYKVVVLISEEWIHWHTACHFDFALALPLSLSNWWVSTKRKHQWEGEELREWQCITVITIIVLLWNHHHQISKRCSFIPYPPCCCFEYWSGINQNSFIYCLWSATRSEVIRVCPCCNLYAQYFVFKLPTLMEIKHNHVCFHTASNYSLFNTLKLTWQCQLRHRERGKGLLWFLISA